MSDTVVKVGGVSKKYCRTIKQTMLYGITDLTKNFLGLNQRSERLRDGEFWALNDISFELNRGECLGLIGPNGSGKSTLLKLLNGIFMPDKGKIEIKGKVGALIEVGAGFHPMLTGRENIYVNGAILGMNKKEIEKKFDQIVEFAELGEFIDSPVKHYSSGMYVRLGFAIAIKSRPDILLVDEVLAVGDSKFQAKCMNAIENIKDSGTSIILVSHNEVIIERNTTDSLFLNQGDQIYIGSTGEALKLYSNLSKKSDSITELFVDSDHFLHVALPQSPVLILDAVFIGFVYKNGNKVCSLVKRITEMDNMGDQIKLIFDLSAFENGQYFLTYRIRDKILHNKIIELVQNNWFEINNNYINRYIGKYESTGIVIEGLGS